MEIFQTCLNAPEVLFLRRIRKAINGPSPSPPLFHVKARWSGYFRCGSSHRRDRISRPRIMVIAITESCRMIFFPKCAIILDELIACIALAICCIVVGVGVRTHECEVRAFSRKSAPRKAECPRVKRASSRTKKAFES